MSNSDTFADFLATPLIIHSEMDEAGFLYELARMRTREAATADFVAGKLEVSDYLDILDDSGIDIDAASQTWNSGQSYLI
jgi:hypothetical protein